MLNQRAACDGTAMRVRWVSPAATVFLFLIMLAFTARYALTLPYWDQWKFVPTLDRMYAGQLTFHDLWAQHNAHRIVFPRLIMLGLARLTDWNIAWEIAVNVLLVAAIFAVLLMYARRSAAFNPHLASRLAPLIAVFTFSLAQWQNLVWGWQMQVLMNVAAALAGLFVLTRGRLSPMRFSAAVLLGVVATFSFANGLAYWIAGLLVLPCTTRRRGWIAMWAGVSIAVYAMYLYGFAIPSSHSGPRYAIGHLLDFVRYVCTFIGGAVVGVSNPLRTTTLGPLWCGVFGLITFALMTLRAAWRGDWRTLGPLAGVALYVLGSAMIAGIGRLDEGGAQALASRYATVAGPFWVVWMLLAIASARTVSSHRRAAIALAVAAVVAAAAVNSARGAHAGSQRCRFALEAREALIAGEPDDLLQRLYPRPKDIRELRPVLMKHGLSVFGE